MMEVQTKAAVASVVDPGERDRLAAAARIETEAARGKFVEHCLALPSRMSTASTRGVVP